MKKLKFILMVIRDALFVAFLFYTYYAAMWFFYG